MKGVAEALYSEPVVFLGAVQAGATGLAAVDVIGAWIPVVTLGIVAALQRRLATPARRRP